MINKKGTDKPIEIFIALFVILAVAMVILKMFSSQIEQKRNEMEEQQEEERIRQAESSLRTYCDTQCANAYRSLKDKVSYCTSYYRDEIDINKNSMPDYTDALDNIQGFCEDRIYCAAFRPCGSLDMNTCKKLICNYLGQNLGMDTSDPVNSDMNKADRLVGFDDSTGRYNGLIQPGDCWNRISEDEKKHHWFYNFMQVPDVMDPGNKCFYIYGTCMESESALNDAYGADWETTCIPPSGDI